MAGYIIVAALSSLKLWANMNENVPFAKLFLDRKFPVLGNDMMRQVVSNLKGVNPGQVKGIKSNTTIFAIIYDKGVLIAGDRRTSDSYFGIASDASTKVVKLTKFSSMACAGYCSVISFLENNMLGTCSGWEAAFGKVLSPDGQAVYLKNLLLPWWFLFLQTWHWMPAIPVLVAYDVDFKKPRIFLFEEDGYFMEPQFFAGTGCGFDVIRALVIDGWRKEITEEETVRLAVKAMIHSGALSAGVSDARLVLPTIAVIDADGFRWVQKEVLAAHRDELVQQAGGLQCLLP